MTPHSDSGTPAVPESSCDGNRRDKARRQNRLITASDIRAINDTPHYDYARPARSKRLHHTQTPLRSPYRSHPAIVIKKTNQGIQEVTNREPAVADFAKATKIRSSNYLRIKLPLRSKVHSAGPSSASNADTSANGLAAINCFWVSRKISHSLACLAISCSLNWLCIPI